MTPSVIQAAATPAPDTSARLERIEQAIDSIAIEVERVSEGQRFVTRLMADGRGNALPAGQPAMEPLHIGEERVAERR